MKTLIEKIIVNYFGTFINGIQKDKLSVDLLGGNFKLENISLNQSYFNDELNSPFKLAYSSIGKLNLQAPLSKLSSSPVECTLDNIYAVFQFRNQHNQKSELSPEEQFRTKKQSLQKYLKEMFETYLKKLREKQDKKEDGMMAKMGKKIIDNLQLKIVNVHIRFEEKGLKSNYGWGLTLEQISFLTTDKEWKPAFIDRSTESMRNEKLLKKMSLKNFNIYWQSGAIHKNNDIFITAIKLDAQKNNKMAAMIKETKYSIISLTSQFKLIINPKQDLKVPLYQLSVELAPIKFDLERAQISEMIDFTQKNMIQNQQILKNLSLKKKKSSVQTQFPNRKQYQSSFNDYVQNYIQFEEAGDKTIRDQVMDDYQINSVLKVLFTKVEYEEILLLALKPIRNRVKITRQKQLKKKKKGWFGGEYQLTEDQLKALSNFVDQEQQKKDTQRPPQCLFFSISLLLNGGIFSLLENAQTEDEEKIQFKIGKIQTVIEKSQNDSLLNLQLNIESIGLDLYLPEYQSSSKNRMNILMNDKLNENSDEKFMCLKFTKKIQSGQMPIIRTDITGKLKRIVMTYKKLYMKKFKSFFTFQNYNQQIKNETMKKWGNIRQKGQEAKQKLKIEQTEVMKLLNLDLTVVSPLFICPLNHSDAWCLNLGKLSILSERNQQKINYPMNVTSAYFRYYQDIRTVLTEMNEKQLNKNKVFSVVNNINFTLMHTKYLQSKSNTTLVDLPNFQVNFTESQYQNFLTLKQIFRMNQDNEVSFLQIMKKNRKQIEDNKKYSGMIKRKAEDLDTWKQYYGILSGQFIYLFGNQKQLKVLEKIQIKQSRLQFNQQQNIITLIHQDGFIEFTDGQQQKNIRKWKNQIEQQMKQFKSIYDIVEEYVENQNDNSNSNRKRKQTTNSVDINRKTTNVRVKIQKISFNYRNEAEKQIINFRVIDLVFNEEKTQTLVTRSINIGDLEITDYIFTYKNQKLQTLLKTNKISVELRKLKKDSHKKIQADVEIPQIHINWKPDVLIILLQLMKKHFAKQKKLRVDDGTEKTRQQLFKEVYSDKKFQFYRQEYQYNSKDRKVKQKRLQYVQKNKRTKQLVKINCKINKMEIIMIHRQSHLPMFKLLTDSIQNQFIMGENQKFVSGTIGLLSLYQLTGYPKDKYKQQKIPKQYMILSSKDKLNKLEPMIEYKWSSYQAFTIPNSQRVDSFLYMTVNPIVMQYFQQITFRLIDYILIQMILLLNQPDMLVANQNLMQQLKRNSTIAQQFRQEFLSHKQEQINISLNKPTLKQRSPIVKIVFSQYEEVIKKIINPYFMDMYFELKKPSIFIRPEKISDNYYRSDFQDIVFSNRNIKTGRRFTKSECQQARQMVYQQQYLIDCNKCDFYAIRQIRSGISTTVKKQRFFQSVDITLLVNKLIQQDQINVIYPQINNYDRSFYTHSKINSLIINKCTKQQYLLLNKLINYNVIYDDYKDQLFIHNFKITKLLSPKPIYYQLKIPTIYLAGKQGTQDNYYDLFQIQMKDLVLIFQRNKDMNSSYNIKLHNCTIYGFQYLLETDKSIVASNNSSPKKHSKVASKIFQQQQSPKDHHNNDPDKSNNNNNNNNNNNKIKYQLVQIKADHQNQCCLQSIIKMKTSGDKVIQVNILKIKADLKLHLLQLIFEWSLLEDWVFPTVSIYANNITFHLTIYTMSAWLQQTFKTDIISQNKANINQYFEILGVFCYKFHRKADYSQQHIQDLYCKKQLTTNQINKMPQTSYMSIIMNTSLFHCQSSLHKTIKRKVIQKMTFNMIQKRFYKVANQQLFTIKMMANRQLNIDRSLFKISFSDVALMGEILQDIGKDRKYIDEIKNIIRKKQQRKAGIRVTDQQRQQKVKEQLYRASKQTQLSSLQNLDVQIQSLSIYLINNSTNSFIPVLRINLNSTTINKCVTSKKNLIKGSLTSTVYYFNNKIFRWQPMLQKCQVIFHKLIYNNMNQNYPETKFSSLQTPDNITLNISKELVIALKDILDQWNKRNDKGDKKLIQGKNKNQQKPIRKIQGDNYHPLFSQSFGNQQQKYESIELVSQYIIRNQTGYDLQIYSHHPPELLRKLQNQEEMDYEYQLQKYDNETTLQMQNILIGIRILHPKYKLKKITHIPLDFNKQFDVMPVLEKSTVEKSKDFLPIYSQLKFVSETKNLKRYCIIKSSKGIEDYTGNVLKKKILQFDAEPNITLTDGPHKGVQVSLLKKFENTKYRYIGENGILKIMPRYLVYNYTPIPLNVNDNQLMPGQFVGVFNNPTIQNIKYDDCKVIKVDKNERTKQFYLSCEGYVIDYAGLYFDFNSSYDAKTFSHDFMHNGYKFTIYLLPDSDCKFKVRLNKKYKSTSDMKCSAVLKTAVGNSSFKLQSPSGSLCQYQAYGYLSQFTGNKYTDFKKIIEITPFYVLSNSTNLRIKVCQLQSCTSMTLEKGDRMPYYWQSVKKPQQIKISTFTQDQMWGYSGPLTITENTHSFVLRNTSNAADYKIFSIVLQSTNTITFVHITQVNFNKGGVLMLSNKVPGISLKFYQASVFEKDHEIMNPQQYIFTVSQGEDVPFGYQLPLQKHQLVMEVALDQDMPQYKGAYVEPIIFSNIETNLFENHISVYKNQKQKKRIKKLLMTLSFEGNIKKLQISQTYEHKDEVNLGQFLCKIPRININLIGYRQKVRKQIAAVYLDGVEFEQAMNNFNTANNLLVRGLKIDNCLKVHPMFPVLFTSSHATQLDFFLEFKIVRDNFNSNLVHYLGISINKSTLSITSDQIQCIQENILQITEAWSKQTIKQYKFREYQMFQQKGQQEVSNTLYFIQAEIRPLKSNITFKHVNQWGGRLIKAFASIDNCNISVDGKKIIHFSSRNIGEFMKHVMKHYEDGVKKMIVPLIGNLSILGSPISLAQRIGSGFKDLIQLPSEGFNISPLQGGKGLAKGAGSLVKNTFEGTFNSFQSVTGSVGNGISTFVFDEDFNRSRQKIKNQKSDHIGKGLFNGGKSIVNGIGRGLTGVVTEPINGAQQSGIGGFFLGGVKGLTGLVTKPISGLFDATTKTFQGIKNTPSFFQSKGNKSLTNGRIRNPRAFYGYNRQFRSFDEDLAVCIKLLVNQDEEKYQNLSWYSVNHLHTDKQAERKPILLLTLEYYVVYSLKEGKILKIYHCENIKSAVIRSKNQISVEIYDKKQKRMGRINITLKQAFAQRLCNQINSICKYYRPSFGYEDKIYEPQFNNQYLSKH